MYKEKILRIFRKRLENDGIKDIDIIIDHIEDLLPEEQKKESVDSLIRFAEKIYQKKYGNDEIFVQIPIPAKLRMNISQFQRSNNLSHNKYKKFIEWINEVSKSEMTIHCLYNEKLYSKFESNYTEDLKIIDQKKMINSKRILTI
jgi:hypothetical protein